MDITDKMNLLDKKLSEIKQLKNLTKNCEPLKNVLFGDVVSSVNILKKIPRENYVALQQRYGICIEKSKELFETTDSFLGTEFFEQYRKDISENKRKHHVPNYYTIG